MQITDVCLIGNDLSYVCLDCPTGFEGDGVTCSDIDEVWINHFPSSKFIFTAHTAVTARLSHSFSVFSVLFTIRASRVDV